MKELKRVRVFTNRSRGVRVKGRWWKEAERWTRIWAGSKADPVRRCFCFYFRKELFFEHLLTLRTTQAQLEDK